MDNVSKLLWTSSTANRPLLTFWLQEQTFNISKKIGAWQNPSLSTCKQRSKFIYFLVHFIFVSRNRLWILNWVFHLTVHSANIPPTIPDRMTHQQLLSLVRALFILGRIDSGWSIRAMVKCRHWEYVKWKGMESGQERACSRMHTYIISPLWVSRLSQALHLSVRATL